MYEIAKKLGGSFKPRQGTLLSPAADFLMAGGASILLYLALIPFNFDPLGQNLAVWATGLYFSAFIINYPHFTASYQLLYQDLSEYFFAHKEHFSFSMHLWWAGLAVPTLLLAYFIFALSYETPYYMGFLVNVMVFTVGWHYVKQIFGCTIVLSAAKQIYYNKLERYTILVPLYLLWFVYYATINTGTDTFIYLGVPYQPLGLPEVLISILTYALYASVVVSFITIIYKYHRTHKLPPLAATAAFVSIFIWFWPANQDNYYYIFIVPFFHSLQYLLFVSAYKKNQAIDQSGDTMPKAKTNYGLTTLLSFIFIAIPIAIIILVLNSEVVTRLENIMQSLLQTTTFGPKQFIYALLILCALAGTMLILKKLVRRSAPLSYIVSFVVKVLVLGFLFFFLIPAILDTLVMYDKLPSIFNYNSAIYGTTLYLFFFTVFVNIHHYFIDNVIWRRNNPKVKQYLYTHDDDMFEMH